MTRLGNIALVIAVAAASAIAAAGVVALVGVEPIRQALRWMFAPALFLMGFAATMLGKVHDLTELKGVLPEKIPGLARMVKTVQVRLWLMIALAVVPAAVGPVMSVLEGVGQSKWLSIGVCATLAAAIASMLYAAIYLPWLYSDYSGVRMLAAKTAKEDEQREALLKELTEAAKQKPKRAK